MYTIQTYVNFFNVWANFIPRDLSYKEENAKTTTILEMKKLSSEMSDKCQRNQN